MPVHLLYLKKTTLGISAAKRSRDQQNPLDETCCAFVKQPKSKTFLTHSQEECQQVALALEAVAVTRAGQPSVYKIYVGIVQRTCELLRISNSFAFSTDIHT